MAVNNQTILEKAWLEGTNDFQQRVPNPSISGIEATVDAIFAPYNKDLYNQFEQLMNMIAFTYVFGRRFDNPLAEFKKNKLISGKTVREVAPKWFRAHSFNPASQDLLKLEKPEFVEWFHTVNRQDYYTFSWNAEELKFAMLQDAESDSLNRLMAATMDALVSSDNYDEMMSMVELFAIANEKWDNGLYKRFVPEPVDTQSANAFLQQVRSLIYRLGCTVSTQYNNVDLPVYARPEELILLVTPEVRAGLDVNAWAAAFNLDYATTMSRIITIPEFPMPNVYAILTTVDFFECRDSVYGIFPAPFNPETMTTKYYLQHWEIISASPMVPIICFTSDPDTERIIIKQDYTGITLEADNTIVRPGGAVGLHVYAEGTVDPSDTHIELAPNAATYELSVSDGYLNARTHVDRNGILHVQKTGLKNGSVITVNATSAYINPSGETPEFTAEVSVTVEI